MADNFEVSVGGNINGLKKAFNEGVKESQKFEKAAISSAVKVEAAIAATGKGGESLKKFTVGSNSAAFALQNLGRVAQDAPFGFIGIQNNLNPLLESFATLRKETGSNKEAFKALTGSLMGPAGIGIALSVVSSAILFYQQYQQRANKATNDAKKGNDDYVASLNQVTQAQLKGTQSAQSELTTLKLLYNQTQNVTLSVKERIKASDQLQEKWPGIFKSFSDEAILAGKAAGKYNELATAIIATGKARAYAEAITENAKRQLLDVQKVTDLEKERLTIQKELAQATAERNFANRQGTSGAGNIVAEQKVLDIEKRLTDNQRAQNALKTDYLILQNRNLDLAKNVNLETAKGGVLDGGVGGLDITPKISGPSRAELLKDLEELKNEIRLKLMGISADISNQPLDILRKSLKQTKAQIATELTSGEPLIPIENLFGEATPATIGGRLYTPFEILKDEINFDLLPALQGSFNNFFEDVLTKGEFSFKSLGDSIKKTFAAVLASEATQALIGLLGAKGDKLEGKGKTGILAALGGVLGLVKDKEGSSAAKAVTDAAKAAASGGDDVYSPGKIAKKATGGAGGLLAGISPAVLAFGGAMIAGSLIKSIVDGVNKNRDLPNLYGPGGSSFIGESRTRGNDLMQTWYRTEKRKGR